MRATRSIPILTVLATAAVLAACDGASPTGPETGVASAGGRAAGSGVEVEGAVLAVDLAASTMTVGGTLVRIDAGTTFDPEGDLHSLAGTATAVDAGAVVRAEARGAFEAGALVARSVKVQTDEPDDPAGDAGGAPGDDPNGDDPNGDGPNDDGPDDDEDAGVDEVEGPVVAVDAGAGLLTLADGTRIRVEASTVIDPLGDLLDLDTAAAAVAAGRAVRAEADGAFEGDAFVAAAIELEVDDDATGAGETDDSGRDGPGDDDGEGDRSGRGGGSDDGDDDDRSGSDSGSG